MTAAELQSRVGHTMRMTIANANGQQPTVTWFVKLDQIIPDLNIAVIHNGYTTLRVRFDDIISVEGGLQNVTPPNGVESDPV